jgi:drug/metabolite transporter (DMT)-like permease
MFHSTPFLALAFVLLWNSGFIGAEFGLPYAKTFTLLFWRYFALALILYLYLVLRSRVQWPGWRRAGPAILVGILAHGVWLSCVLFSLQYGVPAGIVALVVALQPLATGALSGIVVGEYTPIHRWIGLLVGFLGVAMVVFARIDPSDPESVFGYLIPFGSVAAMTAASLIQRRMELSSKSDRLPMDLELFYHCLATFLVLVIPVIMFESLSAQWTPHFIGVMLWLVFAVSLAAYALLWLLLARIDATRVASLFYFGPPVTMVMAWAAFGDTIKLMDLTGLIIVGAGVLLTQIQVRQT